MTALTLVTAPAKEVIPLDEAKLHLRVTITDDDALIEALAIAARQQLEGADGWLGRALITQQWEWTLDAFPCSGVLRVPLPPLQTVDEITYLDTAGVEQTLAADQYLIDIASEPGRITPGYGLSWPATRAQMNAVTVSFTAGYGDEPETVPEPIRAALRLLVAELYAVREPAAVSALPTTVERLLGSYRIWSAW